MKLTAGLAVRVCSGVTAPLAQPEPAEMLCGAANASAAAPLLGGVGVGGVWLTAAPRPHCHGVRRPPSCPRPPRFILRSPVNSALAVARGRGGVFLTRRSSRQVSRRWRHGTRPAAGLTPNFSACRQISYFLFQNKLQTIQKKKKNLRVLINFPLKNPEK